MAGIPRHQGRADPKIGPSDSSDTYADRPDEPATDSDAGETNEGIDRVVSSEEAGLGGGLDQAEEARQGTTDEERARKPKP